MSRYCSARLGVLLAFVCTGCIANTRYGCEQTKQLVAPDQPEGEIYRLHGCPDQVIELGNPVGKDHKHWRKYLVVYRIGEGHELLGTIHQSDKFENIAYLVEDGKVVNGNHVSAGHGEAILGSLQCDGMHPKRRAGYGGDPATYTGSYGQTGRVAPGRAGDRDDPAMDR